LKYERVFVIYDLVFVILSLSLILSMFANMDLVCCIELDFEHVCQYVCDFELELDFEHDFELQACGATKCGAAEVRRHRAWRGRRAVPTGVARQTRQ
jgi:hypothetical protein